MTIEHLEEQLALWKRVLLVCAGASLCLLATAVADLPNHPDPLFPGWFGVWLILQLATVTPAAVLVLDKELRQLPPAERLGTVFGYAGAAWTVLAALGVKLWGAFSVSLPLLAALLGGSGLTLGIAYWLLRRGCVQAPEAMFP